MTGAGRFRCLAFPIAFCAVVLCFNLATAGRWAADTLSNDDASDLLAQVVPGGGVETIQGALAAGVVTPVDDERASRALAAAELVAAMVGNPSRNLPPSCKEWAALHSTDANRDLAQLAVKAIDRIVADSETQELMQEGGAKYLDEWRVSVANLRARLISR